MSEARLGEYLRSMRKEHGFTLRDLAKGAKVSPSYLSDIENDRRVPAVAVLARLASLLALDREDLEARAGKLPEDIRFLLQRHGKAAFGLLRANFDPGGNAPGRRARAGGG